MHCPMWLVGVATLSVAAVALVGLGLMVWLVVRRRVPQA